MTQTSIWLAGFVVACLCAVAYGGAPDDFTPETIIKLERDALDRWGKGDPQGFFGLGAPDETYFDPTVERRVDGAEKLKALLLPFRGKIAIDRYEMIDPLVQRDGNIAVLTFNLIDHGVRVDGVDKGTISWNATEVYRRIDGKWKIIHSHWSYIKPELK
jgi:ketosteroid isomerase-like protein